MLREQVELQRVMLINQDPPEHTTTRQIISRGFTPRAIGALDDIMKQRAEKIVERRPGARRRATSSRTWPPSCRCRRSPTSSAYRRRTAASSSTGPTRCCRTTTRTSEGDPDVAAAEILGYSMEMAADRKANPRDDIVTKLVHADKDGRGPQRRRVRLLRDHAGRGRQRDHPQRDHARHERLPRQPRPVGALEARAPRRRWSTRSIRWATPVTVFQRTALNDVEVGGMQVKKGQRVGLFYASANYDEDVFERPAHLRHHRATPTRTSPSAATARTTASAPTWPARRSS